jgi:predicted ATP-grasp superfamily ATP-dependent carboligase
MRVFVTDGDNRATLAVTRSLGRAGHRVIVGEKRGLSLAQTSRYCAGRWLYPDPVTQGEAWVESVLEALREHRIDVLLPVADITTFLVVHHRARFEALCALPLASTEALEQAADKAGLLARAQRLGVLTPRSVLIERAGEPLAAHDLGYPLVVKPHRSRVQTPAGWKSCDVSFANDAEELQGQIDRRPPHEFPLILQERIVGPGSGVFAYYHHGTAVALFSHRRLRERPPWGGLSVLSESVALEPEARDWAVGLLDDLQWHGVAMVEFKRDVRDGRPRLMEIYGRLWGSLQLAIDAGVDFPRLIVEGLPPGEPASRPPYRIGVRNRWLWGDVDSLLLTLFGGRGAPRTGTTGRWTAVVDFAKFWGSDLHYENPKLGDLRPFFFETYRWFRNMVRA